MREFFKGWRRTVGCCLLLIVCIPAVAWLRSYFVEDRLAFTSGNFRYAISSLHGSVGWDRWINNPPVNGFGWSSQWLDQNQPVRARPAIYRARPGTALAQVQFESRTTAYWPFVVPLSLLSAVLILWKPRPKPKEVHTP